MLISKNDKSSILNVLFTILTICSSKHIGSTYTNSLQIRSLYIATYSNHTVRNSSESYCGAKINFLFMSTQLHPQKEK